MFNNRLGRRASEPSDPRARSYRWGRLRFYALILGCIAAGFGTWNSCNDGPVDEAVKPAVDGKPRPSQTVINNESIAAMGLIPDLDGMAVAYPEEVNELVARDGSFRTELALERMAEMLDIQVPQPDGILFTVVTGTLSEESRHMTRYFRDREKRAGRSPNVFVGEFITEEIPFSIHMLKAPSAELKTVLDAISRSAREMMPEVGERIRAHPVQRAVIDSGRVKFEAGMLPLAERASGGMSMKP